MKAIVFVDVQNDFIKNGKLAFGYPAEDNFQKIVNFAKECTNDPNCKIYATRDTHNATKWIEKDGAQVAVGYCATLEGKKLPVEHCIEGTDGWQIADDLMDILLGKATIVNKPTFGSYDLVNILEEDILEEARSFDEIIICGYDLSICVLANAVLLRAKFPNTKITVKTDLCGDVDKDPFNAAIKVLRMQQIDIAQ